MFDAQTDLRDQVAIVTGASRGLGRHVAVQLARKGVRVAACSRSEAGDLGEHAIWVPMDVSDWHSVERGVAGVRDRFGRVDILVNNAGVGRYKPFEEWSIEEIDAVVDVNLKGTMYLAKAVLPAMQAAGYGQIVNIASDLGRRVLPNMAPYVASKFGVVGFSGSLLREVKGKGVKVMTLMPGIIDTYFNGATEGTKDDTWSLRPEFVAQAIVAMLEFPPHWVVDEIAMHAIWQEF
jgi:NAD(P)-dependent dehydrogenase (short-subunit alcohol dehydrogenase family)